jgi:transposase-like protein
MRAQVVAVGDGVLGFWAALPDVWPETREQRDWVHKVANVLDALPKSTQPTARKMLAEIRDAEDRDHALAAAQRFDCEFRARWPKAADKVHDDLDRLVTFYDFPAEHWLHLKTSNPTESTFSTARLRTDARHGLASLRDLKIATHVQHGDRIVRRPQVRRVGVITVQEDVDAELGRPCRGGVRHAPRTHQSRGA